MNNVVKVEFDFFQPYGQSVQLGMEWRILKENFVLEQIDEKKISDGYREEKELQQSKLFLNCKNR